MIHDMMKAKKFLDDLGVKYRVEGHTIFIDAFYCDGAQDWGIDFWDGEDYPEYDFKEFWVEPDTLHGEIQSTSNGHICSRCKHDVNSNDNYCSHCGAHFIHQYRGENNGSVNL